MTSLEVLKQINDLLVAVVRLGLSNEQNYPTTSGDPDTAFEITIRNASQMSIALKNVSYKEIYYELDRSGCFNIKMLDGALLSLRYRFLNNQVSEHILSFFPSPDLEHFQNDPDIYSQDEVYADVVSKNIVAFPIRFDYCNDGSKYVDVEHPYSHLSLGQYENCRIPVCSPVAPLAFGAFIFRNFYGTIFRKHQSKYPNGYPLFGKTISTSEKMIPHFVVGT